MKHWRIDDVAWDRFDPTKVDAHLVPLIKAAAMVERNGTDYALYLNGVFADDPDFQQAANHWAVEEVQHGDALGRWAAHADPAWDYMASFARYRAGYKIDTGADASVRGSRSGELIARCMVETGTSSYYTALAEATREPVLQQICRLIAADEFRHFKLFYDHLRRYLVREDVGVLRRLRIAAGRVGETEDDELAFAFHCSNDPAGVAYDHQRCIAAYLSEAMAMYRFRHVERGMGMIFKAVGLPAAREAFGRVRETGLADARLAPPPADRAAGAGACRRDAGDPGRCLSWRVFGQTPGSTRFVVIAGLDPAICGLRRECPRVATDRRVKPGNDGC